jgi:hypothetical protein
VGIVVGWLATMGWLFWHDLWPSWRPGDPPRFSIDLVEEVRNSDRLRTYWTVQCQKKDADPTDIFRASTWVDYRQEDDTFALHAELKAKGKEKYSLEFPPLLKMEVESMTSTYRVNRAGQLRELALEVKFRKAGGNQGTSTALPVQFALEGEVRGDQFHVHCRADTPLRVQMDLPPAPVSHSASVLLPLHPVNRIHGLRLGQSWRQPLVDPIGDAFGSLLGGGVHYLDARVLPQPQVLQENDKDKTTCLVIEYEDEDGQFAGRTWVEQDSERVQQQEVIRAGELWIMKRDNPRQRAPGIFPRR